MLPRVKGGKKTVLWLVEVTNRLAMNEILRDACTGLIIDGIGQVPMWKA